MSFQTCIFFFLIRRRYFTFIVHRMKVNGVQNNIAPYRILLYWLLCSTEGKKPRLSKSFFFQVLFFWVNCPSLFKRSFKLRLNLTQNNLFNSTEQHCCYFTVQTLWMSLLLWQRGQRTFFIDSVHRGIYRWQFRQNIDFLANTVNLPYFFVVYSEFILFVGSGPFRIFLECKIAKATSRNLSWHFC